MVECIQDLEEALAKSSREQCQELVDFIQRLFRMIPSSTSASCADSQPECQCCSQDDGILQLGLVGFPTVSFAECFVH